MCVCINKDFTKNLTVFPVLDKLYSLVHRYKTIVCKILPHFNYLLLNFEQYLTVSRVAIGLGRKIF